jgi:hypothetical protein
MHFLIAARIRVNIIKINKIIMVISIIIIIKLLILYSIDFCLKSKEQRLKITKIDNVAKILILILVCDFAKLLYFQELSFLENKFVKFYKHKNNATLYIIFAAKAVKFLPGIATCGEGGFFLKA